MKHISVVISYYERLRQLEFTLRTIANSEYKDFDVIIVNDVSQESQSIDHIPSLYSFPIKVVNLKPPKMWRNPCYAFNVGFKEATGDIVLMNQCECCHKGDLISRTADLVRDDNYISFQTYSIDKGPSEFMQSCPPNASLMACIDLSILPINNAEPEWSVSRNGWWNHHVYRPMGFHWASAMTRKNLEKLRGFDERFAKGWWFDDTEFLDRIRRLGLAVEIVDDPNVFCIHQFHDEVVSGSNPYMIELNTFLYEYYTLKETSYRAPCNSVYNPE